MVVALYTEVAPAAPTVLGATLLLMLIGIITPDQAFAGFSNEAPIIVASLLVVARAVDVAGIMQPIVARLFRGAETTRGILARLLFPLAGISAFVNNTTLVAMTIPAVIDISARRNLPASRFLMPVSYAAILGGVVTTIGTSTNLTVSGLLSEAGMRPLGLFEPTVVGLPIAIAGVAVLVLLVPRLLPDRTPAGGTLTDTGRDFTVSMRVEQGGEADGSTVTDAGLRQLQGVFLVEIERDGRSIAPVAPDEVLEGGDLLTFVGRVDNIVDLQRVRGLTSAEARQIGSLAGQVHAFYEVVVGAGGDLVGQTLKQVDFRARYDAAVIAIHRAGHRVDAKLGDIALRVGDTLLILSDPAFRARWRDRQDFLVIAPLSGISPRQPRRAWLIGGVFVGFILATGSGLVPILHASIAAAMIVVATRVLTVRQARDAVDLQIVVLIASAFGLGAAVSASGLAEVIAGGLVGVMSPLGAIGAPCRDPDRDNGADRAPLEQCGRRAHVPDRGGDGGHHRRRPAAIRDRHHDGRQPVLSDADRLPDQPDGLRPGWLPLHATMPGLGVPLNVVTTALSLVLIPIAFPF